MIPLHEPKFSKTDIEAVVETLESGWVSTGGPDVEKFELEFAKYVGSDFAVSFCSGTAAIQVMIEVLRDEMGFSNKNYEVITPSLTFIATANAIVHAGGTPALMDVEHTKMNLSSASIVAAINENYTQDILKKTWTNKTSNLPLLAVLPVNIMGWCCNLAKLAGDLKEMNIPMIEDAAESLGSYDNSGAHTGTLGAMGAFSFNGNKILTTGGGGMVVTNQDRYAKKLKHLSTTAKTDTLRYLHDEVGYNFRMVNILAALGRTQLKTLNSRLKEKAEIADMYRKFLNHPSGIKVYSEELKRPNNWLVNLVFSSERQRENALRNLNENGVQARPLWTPVHLQPAFKNRASELTKFKNTEFIWKTALSVPTSAHLKEEDIFRICKIILDSIEN